MNNNNNIYDYDNDDDDTRQVVKLRKEKLLKCLTCPVCHNLFSDATTISECLHSFCRQCIYDKIEGEDLDCCPVCNTDLGGAPLDKLRADHNLQDLRTKLFPPELEKREAVPDVTPSIPAAAKQKERSLSSLVVSSPKQSPQPIMFGRRKYPMRKSLVVPRKPALPPPEETSKKAEDFPKSFTSPQTLRKEVSVNGRQKKSTTDESPEQQIPSNAVKDNVLADLLKLPNRVVEATGEETKANNDNERPREAVVESDSLDAPNGRAQEHEAEAKIRRRSKRSRVHGHGNGSTPSQSGPVTRRKIQRRRQRRETVVPERGESSNSAAVGQNMGNANSQVAGRFNPIWFSLIASNHQEGNEPLPQISSCYLRVKDASLTVSLVKKYVAKKLDLASDAEVEITLGGQPLISTLQLRNLVDLWIRTSPSASKAIQPSAGSSGKDIMLVLSYGRKARPLHRHVTPF